LDPECYQPEAGLAWFNDGAGWLPIAYLSGKVKEDCAEIRILCRAPLDELKFNCDCAVETWELVRKSLPDGSDSSARLLIELVAEEGTLGVSTGRASSSPAKVEGSKEIPRYIR
jgi:hypothetical protein